jgi:integral membrane protein
MTENNSQNSAIKFFLRVGWIEGWSYIILLGVAMPLKYFANLTQAVSLVGSLHGALFVLFMFSILRCLIVGSLSLKQCAAAFFASLVPFGTFFLDRILTTGK